MQVADHFRIHQSTPITRSCVIHGGFVVTFWGGDGINLMFLISHFRVRILDSTRVSM